jgi:hypothetical protein
MRNVMRRLEISQAALLEPARCEARANTIIMEIIAALLRRLASRLSVSCKV